jgi:hypothetical protein
MNMLVQKCAKKATTNEECEWKRAKVEENKKKREIEKVEFALQKHVCQKEKEAKKAFTTFGSVKGCWEAGER